MLRKLIPALAVLALAPGTAGAYTTERGREADGRVITYYNAAPEHEWAVEQAVRAWNESGADVEFTSAPRGEAEMVINADAQGLNGHARSVHRGGEPQPGDAQVSLPSLSKDAAEDSRFSVVLIAVHELGHVLGLNHEDSGCATMNSTITNLAPAQCEQPPAGQWRCRMLEEDDVRGAVSLYGGRSRLSGPRHCSKTAADNDASSPASLRPDPLPPPDVVEATSSPGDSSRVTVRWLNGTSDRIRSAVVARAEGRCPGKPGDGEERRVDAEAETESSASFALELESTCYAVWSRDRKGDLSEEPAIAWLDGPASPKPPTGFVATPALSLGLGDTGVSLRWHNAEVETVRSVVIARARDRCPTRPPRRARPWDSPDAEPDAYQELYDLRFYPGADAQRYCYAIWSRDRFGRLSRPATAWPGAAGDEEELILLAG